MPEILVLTGIVRRESNYRPSSDERRRVNYVLASYRDSQGREYRKGFSSYQDPVVPESGTIDELLAMSEQRFGIPGSLAR